MVLRVGGHGFLHCAGLRRKLLILGVQLRRDLRVSRADRVHELLERILQRIDRDVAVARTLLSSERSFSLSRRTYTSTVLVYSNFTGLE